MGKIVDLMGALTRDVPRACAGKIIIAEDEFLVRLMLAETLRAAGFIVHEALNGEEAISLLTALPHVDAVVTDMHMRTSVDGNAVLEFVRAHQPHVLVLLASAHSPNGHYFDAVFQKPIEPSQIVVWLKERIANGRARRVGGG